MSQGDFTSFRVNLYIGRKHETFVVATNPFYIGRDYEADLLVLDRNVSRKHLKVEWDGTQILVSDCGSANGTTVGDQVLSAQESMLYSPGERIQLGTGQCFLFIELHQRESARNETKGAMGGLSDLLQTKGMILDAARSKAESMLLNAAAIKQSISKEALQSAEQRLEAAAAEAVKTVEEAKKEAEILIEEGKRLAAEFKGHAEEQAERELGNAARKAEELESRAKELSQKLQHDADLRVREAATQVEEQRLELESLKREATSVRAKSEVELADLTERTRYCEEAYHKALAAKSGILEELGALKHELFVVRDEVAGLKAEVESKKATILAQEKKEQEIKASCEESLSALTKAQIQLEKLEAERQALTEKREHLIKSGHDAEIKTDKLIAERDLCQSLLAIEKGHLKKAEDELSVLKKHQQLAKEEAERLLADAQAQSAQLHEQTLVETQARTQEAGKAAEKALRVAEAEAVRIRSRAEKAAKKIVLQERKNQRKLLKKSYLDQQVHLSQAKRQAEEIVSQAEQEREALIEATQLRCEELSDAQMAEAKLRYEQMISEAQEHYDTKIAEFQAHYDSKHTEADSYHQDRCQEADSYYNAKRAEATELYEKAKQQSADSLRKARLESQELLRSTEVEVRDQRSRAESELKQQIKLQKSQWEVEYKGLEARLKAENQKKTDELAKEMMEKRVAAERELEAELNERRAGAENERKLHLHRLTQETQILVGSRLKSYIDQEKLQRQGIDLGMELEAAIRSALYAGELSEEEKLKVYGEDPAEKQNKVKVFYKRAGLVAAAVVLLAVLTPVLRPYLEEKAVKLVKENTSESDSYVQSVTEAWKNKPKFEPTKTPEYKATYTDRVVYTEDYPQRELDGAYREKWIVDLNTYVIEELRLSENAIIPFVSKEVNLVRELSQKTEKINPDFAEEGIERLREIEEVFTAEVKELLKTEKNFKKVQEFKKKHYQDYFAQAVRRLASDHPVETPDLEDEEE